MNDKQQRATAYWKVNLKYLLILLSIWFAVSYGAGILLVDWLNRFRLGGFQLGFWFAQQGSIYVFVILIFVYVYLMNRLDRKYGYREEQQTNTYERTNLDVSAGGPVFCPVYRHRHLVPGRFHQGILCGRGRGFPPG